MLVIVSMLVVVSTFVIVRGSPVAASGSERPVPVGNVRRPAVHASLLKHRPGADARLHALRVLLLSLQH
jgi:hypothetical protein